MTDIILCGCFGHMGRVISEIVSERDDCRIVAGIDTATGTADFPVFTSPSLFKGKADVLIDFSHPSALSGVLGYAVENSLPAVIATTGLDERGKEELNKASEKTAIFFSANMSLGVNLLSALSKAAAKVLGKSYDIEIVEMHHNRKIDAPSGTALLLADEISSALDEKPEYEYNRHDRHVKRPKNEIGIHSVRGGTIVGEHQVIFAGTDEVITLSHSAGSRKIFASGAVNAAIWLKGKAPGIYDMSSMIEG
ncbi:MAG: 4-hydroxy-tetrahydrodipicolinate reductase [Clostridiales bacterium]|nr:4-hydroxy-tetrahydrodipicolinate reductase [Clostridiales bacterium]